MAVGDFVHSKDAGDMRPAASPRKARQLRAEQFKVDVPTMKLVNNTPSGEGASGGGQQETVPDHRAQVPSPDAVGQKDMFDTDVEGIDDSTIAATSVVDVDELKSLPGSRTNAAQQQSGAASRTSHQLEQNHERRAYGQNWYEELGAKPVETASFESEDGESDGSQITSSQAEDDGQADLEQTDAVNWYIRERHRNGEAPLSRRLESFWAASKRNHTKATNFANDAATSAAISRSASNPRNAGPMLSVGGNRKVTLPRNMNYTTRNRFSPAKPTLLEELDRKLETSPSRQPNGLGARAGRTVTTTEHEDPKTNNLARNMQRRDSGLSTNAFDVTHMEFFDEDETSTINHDIFHNRRQSPPSRDKGVARKRHLEADYPLEVIQQKSFDDLQAEPFDRTPTPAPSTVTKNPTPEPGEAADKISILLRIPDRERRSYLCDLSVDEWEDCGDQLIERFSAIMTKMKELRQTRRRTAALFEAEIKRRHLITEEQSADLSKKLQDMREGGIGVLRGRSTPS